MLRTEADMSVSQLRATDFMVRNLCAGIFLDMGLGKTGAALTAITEINELPVLIIGPIRVIETVWPVEAKLWAHTCHLKFSVIRGNEDARIAAVAKKADIYLINPEHLRWFLKKYKKYLKAWRVLIVDESSDFKTPGSKRFMSLRWRVRHFRRRYILTGTPRPNSLLDLWAQIFILDEGARLQQRFEWFKDRYFEPKDFYGYKWGTKKRARKRIYEHISDLIIRIESKGRKPTINRILVPLPPKVMKAYNEMEDEALAYLDDQTELTAVNVVAAMMKCRQMANGAVYLNDDKKIRVLHSEKINVTQKIIEETGSPVIVVYNFKHERDLLAERLKAYEPVILSKAKNPKQVIADWNAGKIPVLLLHPKSGGHGLNLQHGGHTMVWFGLTFSYEQYAQTIARINRTGQKKKVVLHILIAPNTVDELVEAALKAKARGQNKLLKFLKKYSDARDTKPKTGKTIRPRRRKHENDRIRGSRRSRQVYFSQRARRKLRA
jgi:SNF2 family DNA or RNA helicase